MAIAEKQINMTAAVLCGGRSRRFGSPKEWLDFNGRPLLAHVVHTVRPLFSHVLAVGLRPDAPHLPADVEPVADTLPGAGPLNGIVAALRASKTEHTFFFACDTPLIRPALVRAMQAQAAGAHAVVPRSGPHFQPLFAIYARSCLPIAEKQLAAGRLKISDMYPLLTLRIIDEHQQRLHDHDLLSFFNINTTQDYERALELLHPGRTPLSSPAAD
jgi:molybdopterin-guanine dinucleotide biosynthesis protein A